MGRTYEKYFIIKYYILAVQFRREIKNLRPLISKNQGGSSGKVKQEKDPNLEHSYFEDTYFQKTH